MMDSKHEANQIDVIESNESNSSSHEKDDILLDIDDFILQKQIGRGSFGKVYKVSEKGTDKIYAAKVSKTKIADASDDIITDLKREINIISKLDHPLVLKFKGYSPTDFKNNPRPVIITEYSSNGTLEDFIEMHRHYFITKSDLYSTSKLIIIYGIASAMAYLHSHGIIHRDLKPANILMNEFLLPKIADFGLSKVDDSKLNTHSNIRSPKGTPIYMAPEIWEKSEYSQASDVYAFSLIVFEILTSQKPLENLNIFTIPIKVKNGYRPEFKKSINESFKKLIESCWHNDPKQRPTFDQICIQLKNDRSFLTESVNEEKFFKFVKLIDEYNSSFNTSDFDVNFTEGKHELNSEFKLNFLKKNCHFSYRDFNELEDECKEMVIEAENDPKKQFEIGKYLIEGQFLFPKKTMAGIKYLKQSMKSDVIESAIYYCEMLIKGGNIPKSFDKAEKILENEIKGKDQGTYLLLYGKLYKKMNKTKEAKECFRESISSGNSESMYEYGKLLYKEDNQKEEAIKYFKQSILNGCLNAMYKYGLILIADKKEEEEEEEGFKYIKMAADKGHQKALYYYYTNCDDNNDEYLKSAAYAGNIDAMLKYALKLAENKEEANNIKESILFIKKASDSGHLESIYNYGRIFFDGIMVPADLKKAAFYMKIAANQGHSEAMQVYGFQLLTGNGVKEDRTEAAKYFKLAADKGHLIAIKYYGSMLQEGIGVAEDTNEALKYLKIAADNGDVESMTSCAHILSGVNHRIKTSYRQNLDKSDDEKLYENNFDDLIVNEEEEEEEEISEEDKKEAAKYYKLAADSGDTEAMMYYGNCLIDGEGVETDKEEGIKYIKMAVDKGNTDAMICYAFVLRDGVGVDVDVDGAVEYLKIAIENGNSEAMYEYGYMLKEGSKIQPNKEEAVKYLKMAIDKGNTDAMCAYGSMLKEGDGIEADKEEAIKYFKMASDKGNLIGNLEYSMMLLDEMNNYNNYEEEEEV